MTVTLLICGLFGVFWLSYCGLTFVDLAVMQCGDGFFAATAGDDGYFQLYGHVCAAYACLQSGMNNRTVLKRSSSNRGRAKNVHLA